MNTNKGECCKECKCTEPEISGMTCDSENCECHSLTSEMGWERKADKFIEDYSQSGYFDGLTGIGTAGIEIFKNFIRETLQSERSNTVERVRGLKFSIPKESNFNYAEIYEIETKNQACDEVIKILQSPTP